MEHLVTLKDWSSEKIREVLDLAQEIKTSPDSFRNSMSRKMLVMIFEKPSLRTRVSFETGACQMGGDAIYYDTSSSPMGAGKETIADSIKVLSRYADIVMARLFKHEDMEEMARCATIPVINGLTDYTHPCQIMADLQTIREKRGELAGQTLAYVGDSNNNVTHSLMIGCAKMGMNVRVGCPDRSEHAPLPEIVDYVRTIAEVNGTEVVVCSEAAEAVRGANVVYTDSWMSYHIPKDQLEARVKIFTPYQVTAALMQHAAADAIFMNCLPALRGYEQTAEVIDGPQSVVFDQAENRLHAQKAVVLALLNQ